MSAPEKASAIAAREVTAAMVRQHGAKRGLHLSAVVLGCSERWARGIHYGEVVHISHALADRAAEARITLARQRAAQLRAELLDIERSLHGETVGRDSTRGDVLR
jgi:hypothetical protein